MFASIYVRVQRMLELTLSFARLGKSNFDKEVLFRLGELRRRDRNKGIQRNETWSDCLKLPKLTV